MKTTKDPNKLANAHENHNCVLPVKITSVPSKLDTRLLKHSLLSPPPPTNQHPPPNKIMKIKNWC